MLWFWINEPLIWICRLKLTCGSERSVVPFSITLQLSTLFYFCCSVEWLACFWILKGYHENLTYYLNESSFAGFSVSIFFSFTLLNKNTSILHLFHFVFEFFKHPCSDISVIPMPSSCSTVIICTIKCYRQNSDLANITNHPAGYFDFFQER